MTDLEDAVKNPEKRNCPSPIKLNWAPTPKVTPSNYTRCQNLAKKEKRGPLKNTKNGQLGDHTES